jgi:hypothetical protein
MSTTAPDAVLLCSTLQWPAGALGRRPLVVFEPYDISKFALEEGASTDVTGWLKERGFAPLVKDSWDFPLEHELVLGVFKEFDTPALIDEGDDLLNYPLGALPTDWFAHLQRERVCLVVTGANLQLTTLGMEGVHQAVARGDAFGAMVMINDGRVHEGLDTGRS